MGGNKQFIDNSFTARSQNFLKMLSGSNRFGAADAANNLDSISITGQRFTLGVRHVQCFLLFCGLAVSYALRVNLSMAIVAMTDKNSTNSNFREFDWDESIKSYLLSSFFWGYVITQIPGSYLAHVHGAKLPLFFGVLVCSLLAILTPICALIGNWELVLALRALQGLCQGVIFPSTHTFLSKWAPAHERGGLVTFVYSGTHVGTVIMLSISGYIASSWLGWPCIFYASGVMGLIWAFIWLRCGVSTPNDHNAITVSERQLIQSTQHTDYEVLLGVSSSSPPRPPWFEITTSVPFITLIVVHCCNNFGFWTLLTEMPTYMKNILGIDIRSNGSLSALPYLTMCLLSFVFIFIAGVINRYSWMSLNFCRKFFNTMGQLLPMLALISLGYWTADGNKNWPIVLLTIAVGTNSATYLGVQVNHIDLSPNFAGTLMGITNCFGNLMSIIAPLLVGLVVTDEKNPAQWRIIFFIAASFYFVGSILFLVFGRTSTQHWNSPVTRSRRCSVASNDEVNTE